MNTHLSVRRILGLCALTAVASAVPLGLIANAQAVTAPASAYSDVAGQVMRDITGGGVVIQPGQNISLGSPTPNGAPGAATQPVPKFSAINAPLWINQNGPAQIGDDLLVQGVADLRMGISNTTMGANNVPNPVVFYDEVQIKGNSTETGNLRVSGGLMVNGTANGVNGGARNGLVTPSQVNGGILINKRIDPNNPNLAAITTSGGIMINNGYLNVAGGDVMIRAHDLLITGGGSINAEGNLEVGSDGSSAHQMIGTVSIIGGADGALRADGDVTVTSGTLSIGSGSLSVGATSTGGLVTIGRISPVVNGVLTPRKNDINIYGRNVTMLAADINLDAPVHVRSLESGRIGRYYRSSRGSTNNALPRNTTVDTITVNSTNWSTPIITSCGSNPFAELLSCTAKFPNNSGSPLSIEVGVDQYSQGGADFCRAYGRKRTAQALDAALTVVATCFNPSGEQYEAF